MTPLTKHEALILEACRGASKEHPVTRSQLKDLTHLTDRKNRDVIGHLRDAGYRIAHSAKGYWYAAPEEYAEWIRLYTSYAYTILRRRYAMDRMTEGQLELSLTTQREE